jgi:hypothetical protein
MLDLDAEIEAEPEPECVFDNPTSPRISGKEGWSPVQDLNLEETLRDPEKIKYFKQFLEKEYNNENLLFWLEVESYKTLADTKALIVGANNIYKKFIDTEAPFAINLPFNFVNQIKQTLDAANALPNPDISPHLYDHAQVETFKLMQSDPFPRFLKSCFYSAMYASAHQKNINIPDRVFEEILKDEDETTDNGWGPAVFCKDGVKVYKKMYKDSRIYCFRSSTVISVPPLEVFKMVTDLNKRHLWDDIFVKGRVVEDLGQLLLSSSVGAYIYTKIDALSFLGDGVQILHMEWKSPKKLLVHNRDFVTLRVQRPAGIASSTTGGISGVGKNNSLISIMRSIVHSAVPPQKGYVRGELESSGFVVTPNPENPYSCKVTYVVQVC